MHGTSVTARTGSGVTTSHTYATAGTYAVRLTVTDASGGTGTVTHDVTVSAPANQLPTARFTHTENNLQVSVNGSTSSDPEGTTLSYAWDFGDGTDRLGGDDESHLCDAVGPTPSG